MNGMFKKRITGRLTGPCEIGYTINGVLHNIVYKRLSDANLLDVYRMNGRLKLPLYSQLPIIANALGVPLSDLLDEFIFAAQGRSLHVLDFPDMMTTQGVPDRQILEVLGNSEFEFRLIDFLSEDLWEDDSIFSNTSSTFLKLRSIFISRIRQGDFASSPDNQLLYEYLLTCFEKKSVIPSERLLESVFPLNISIRWLFNLSGCSLWGYDVQAENEFDRLKLYPPDRRYFFLKCCGFDPSEEGC